MKWSHRQYTCIKERVSLKTEGHTSNFNTSKTICLGWQPSTTHNKIPSDYKLVLFPKGATLALWFGFLPWSIFTCTIFVSSFVIIMCPFWNNILSEHAPFWTSPFLNTPLSAQALFSICPISEHAPISTCPFLNTHPFQYAPFWTHPFFNMPLSEHTPFSTRPFLNTPLF